LNDVTELRKAEIAALMGGFTQQSHQPASTADQAVLPEHPSAKMCNSSVQLLQRWLLDFEPAYAAVPIHHPGRQSGTLGEISLGERCD
jgi:hypothetical protein